MSDYGVFDKLTVSEIDYLVQSIVLESMKYSGEFIDEEVYKKTVTHVWSAILKKYAPSFKITTRMIDNLQNG